MGTEEERHGGAKLRGEATDVMYEENGGGRE